MKNIFKRRYTYKIVSDLETTRKIQEFVNPYRTEDSEMVICVSRPLTDYNNHVTVEIESFTNREEFVENLKKEFVCYDVHDRKTLIFVWREKKEES